MTRDEIAALCKELQALQRMRAYYIKAIIASDNRLKAQIAVSLGYRSGLSESEREKFMKEAGKIIKAVQKGEMEHALAGLILATTEACRPLDDAKSAIEKEMVDLVKRLPIAPWVERPEQRGFGFQLLATLLGETGDLFNYSTVAKLWRRMGCAPYTVSGSTRMGEAWNKKFKDREGDQKMSADDWTAFGYSPRRRSIAYMIGECLLKQNKGPYRTRYDEAVAKMKADHPEYTKQHCHKHGMLCATKLLLRELWKEWRARGGV